VEMGVPLQEVSGRAADELEGGFGCGCGSAELGQEVAPTAEPRPKQARNGEHHVTVGHGSEQLLPRPFGPEELLLLLAGGAEAAPAAGEGDQHAPVAL